MLVVDTTVLVYAVGDDHPLRPPCRDIIERAGDGRLRVVTTVEVIQEFAHVRARRRDRTDAAQLAVAASVVLAPLLQPDADDLGAAMELWELHPDLGAFDAVLAATARRAGAEALVTSDRSFHAVAGLDVWNPADATFRDRLASAS